MVRWTSAAVGTLGVAGLAALVAGTLPAAREGGELVSTSVTAGPAALPTGTPVPDPAEVAPSAATTPPATPSATPSASPSPAPAPTASTTAPAVLTCTSAALGYSLDYPAAWVVATEDPERLCRFFSSTAAVPAADGGNLPEAEIRVLQARVPYAELLADLESSVFEVTERRETSLLGRDAVVLRYEHPDDPGAGGYVAVLDRGEAVALYVEARERDSADFAATVRVLDAMLLSLEAA